MTRILQKKYAYDMLLYVIYLTDMIASANAVMQSRQFFCMYVCVCVRACVFVSVCFTRISDKYFTYRAFRRNFLCG